MGVRWMSWRGARGFKMSSAGARGFSRGAQGVQGSPLNPLYLFLPAAVVHGIKEAQIGSILP
jgi:hypothetical protein